MEMQVDASKLAFRLATNLRPLALVFADLCSAIDLKELNRCKFFIVRSYKTSLLHVNASPCEFSAKKKALLKVRTCTGTKCLQTLRLPSVLAR